MVKDKQTTTSPKGEPHIGSIIHIKESKGKEPTINSIQIAKMSKYEKKK